LAGTSRWGKLAVIARGLEAQKITVAFRERLNALGLRIDVSRTIIAIESIKLESHAEDV
jgi:hypothetical protein